MQVSFYLDKSNSTKDGFFSIFYSITFKGGRIRKKVQNVKTTLKHWNTKSQRVKVPLKAEPYNYHIEYNMILDEHENKIKTIFRYILLNKLFPTTKLINEKLMKNSDIELTHEFFISFQEFIDKNKSTKAKRTLKTYLTTLNYLKEFSNATGYQMAFDTINYDFFETLQDYSYEEKQIKNNYFAKIIAVLKTFMSWAFDRSYHSSLEFKKFKAKEHEIEVIYLTIEELLRLYNYEFKTNRLKHVRDVYCFGCFTGLRFSDLALLRESNIYKDHIKLNIQKTKTIDHRVPLNKYSESILKKYKGTIYEPLPLISNQKFNKYIKECCKTVDINKPITITRYIGSKRIDQTVPKYELITSHTARKTFVTNSLILGMKEMVVRNITGHKKDDSFKKYVKIAEDFKRQEMDNSWNKINQDG